MLLHTCVFDLTVEHSFHSVLHDRLQRDHANHTHMRERHQMSSRIRTYERTSSGEFAHTHTHRQQAQCIHANGFRVVSGRTSAAPPQVVDLAACLIAGLCFVRCYLMRVKSHSVLHALLETEHAFTYSPTVLIIDKITPVQSSCCPYEPEPLPTALAQVLDSIALIRKSRPARASLRARVPYLRCIER